MMFASREDAGQKLGRRLQAEAVGVDWVLGLPRGGVVVAAEVARVLQRPLDVLVVRKIGHPFHREFAVGALAEHDVVILDEGLVGRHPQVRDELQQIIAEESNRLRAYQARFHPGKQRDFSNQRLLLVDDGLATGATIEAAVLSARRQQARRVIVAAPVASTNAVERLGKVADGIAVLFVDPDFDAVGRYYAAFSQTTDEEVLALLETEHTAG